MNLIKKSMLALSALAAVSTMHAQSDVAKPTGALGIRYAEASFGVQDIKHLSDEAYSLGASVNLPIQSSLDLGFGYSYAWLDSVGELRSEVLAASLTFHEKIQGVTAFTSVALGYAWDRAALSGVTARETAGVWGVAVGVEVPFRAVTITPRISYTDSFKSYRDYSVNYGVEATHWFTAKLAGFADVSYIDPKGSDESWNYTVGLRLKF